MTDEEKFRDYAMKYCTEEKLVELSKKYLAKKGIDVDYLSPVNKSDILTIERSCEFNLEEMAGWSPQEKQFHFDTAKREIMHKLMLMIDKRGLFRFEEYQNHATFKYEIHSKLKIYTGK